MVDDTVEEIVLEAQAVVDSVGDPETVVDCVGVIVLDAVTLELTVADLDTVLLRLAVADNDNVDDAVIVALTDPVTEPESVDEGV